MSKEATRRFIEAWGNKEPHIEAAFRPLPGETLNDPEALAAIAVGLGYDVTSAELVEAFDERRRQSIEVIDGEELSSDDLEQVAGGTIQPCDSDYNPDDWCWFDDRCTKSWHYYKKQAVCVCTFEEDEECQSNDICSFGLRKYHCTANEVRDLV